MLACVAVFLGGCSGPLSSAARPAIAVPTATTVIAPPPTPSMVAELPSGRVVTADEVMFSEDMQTLRLSFVGAREWSPEDPVCTADYAGWANDTGEILEVAVVNTVETRPGGLTPDGHVIECDLVGYGREVIVELPGPFRGSSVRNLERPAYPLAIAENTGLYEIPASALPEVWALRPTVSLLESVPPFPSFRTYSPTDLPALDDPQLRMIQYFEAVAGQGPQGTGTVSQLDLHGTTVFLVERPDGQLILSWNSLSGDPITVMAAVGALSVDELITAGRAARLEAP